MRFPPIKADRGLLWITLVPDAGAAERYAALHAILKTCRLHPLDTTASAELVIVEAAAVQARRAEIEAVLGVGDVLHLITRQGERLSVDVIAGNEAAQDAAGQRPAQRQPPWLAT